MFDDLPARGKEYAQQRRLEEITRKSKGDPMHVSQLTWEHDHNQYWATQEEEPYDQYQRGCLDALSKGKGAQKGKNKYGNSKCK